MSHQTQILVVDDQPHQRRAASRVLTQAGYDVWEAATGEEGLRVIRKIRPDLILLNTTLPDMDGLAMGQRIKAEAKLANSFVVLLSCPGADADSMLGSLEGSADGYIALPFSDRELLSQVQALLRLKHAEEALWVRTHELEEQARHLNCLYSISRLVEQAEIPLDEILQGIVDLMPPAWQYPAIACVRLVLNSHEYRTGSYRESNWTQSRGIWAHGQPVGRLEVCYLEERPAADEGPFTEAERSLLDAIADRLGKIIERLQTAAALRESEEKFRNVSEQSPNAILIHLGDRIVYANFACEAILGYGRQELYDPHFDLLSLLAPEYRDLVRSNIHAQLRDQSVLPCECEIVTRQGERIAVILSQQPIPYHGQTAIVGTFTDVTQLKLAEKALAHSERRYRQLVEGLQEGIWALDREAHTTFVNPRMAEMLGYTAEEMLGRHLFEFMDAQQIEVAQHYLERRQRGIGEQHDFKFLRKDGTPIFTSLETSPLIDADGNYVGALAGVMDITGRRLAEDALREAKEAAESARRDEEARRQEAERGRRIAEGLGDVLAVLNSNRSLDEVLDYIASQAGQLLGTRAAGIYSLEQAGGGLSVRAVRGLLATYVTGAETPIGLGALHRAMASRQPVAVPDVAAALANHDGLVLSAEHEAAVGAWAKVYRALLAVPIVVHDHVYGGMLLYYGVPRAFSEEEVALAVAFADQVALAIGNAQLREQVRRAAMLAERDRLARDLHDAVTQTLFSASLIAEAMPRVWERNPQEGRRGLEELRSLTRGAAAEMRTLLVELRPAALTQKPLDELLRHLTEAVASHVGVPIHLDVTGNGTLPPDVQIIMYRIVQEALNNIVKHAAASRISVSLHCQPQQARLDVIDDGCGFDPDNVSPERFGLVFMRERAQGIGAVLKIDSRPGQGTWISVNWQDTKKG